MILLVIGIILILMGIFVAVGASMQERNAGRFTQSSVFGLTLGLVMIVVGIGSIIIPFLL